MKVKVVRKDLWIVTEISKCNPLETLNEKEEIVLTGLMLGKTDKDIIEKLSISRSTLRVHLAKVYEKLNACSRTEDVAKIYLGIFNEMRRKYV